MLRWVKEAWRFCVEVVDEFSLHRGGLLSAAIAYFTLLSVTPLLTIGVSVVGWVAGGSGQAMEEMHDIVARSFPAQSQLVSDTLSAIERDRGLLGVVGLLGLVLTGSGVFASLEAAFNAVWRVGESRSWLRQRLMAASIALLAPVALLASMAASWALAYVRAAPTPILGVRPGEIPLIWQVAGFVAPLGLVVALFVLLYRIIPNRRVGWRYAFLAATFAGSTWEMAKHLFTFYLAHFARYSYVYGSLAGVVILAVWIYLSAATLLLGAIIAATVERRRTGAPAPPLHCPSVVPDAP
ncbi:MAG TPA: YihY/virulence factor BrkB family protein [Chthonomonadales bacterium]|nr:YihY/virulence factor BrkB family protein [Chthonomonadales bacterium]